jgi:maltodextrin utilization protein YvdJ
VIIACPAWAKTKRVCQFSFVRPSIWVKYLSQLDSLLCLVLFTYISFMFCLEFLVLELMGSFVICCN